MHLLHENLSSCLAFCICKVMSIKLPEKRKAPAEPETLNLDDPKLQIFLNVVYIHVILTNCILDC